MDLATTLKLHVDWLRNSPGGVKVDLRGADLRGADLSRANLSRADLRGADLSEADLSRANLRRADLRGADLSRADLSRADLSGANLSEANLILADLSRADLSGANLSEANLRRADLSRADLNGTCLDALAALPALTDAEISAAGLVACGDYVLGYRTARSHQVDQKYYPGEVYVAPWFSVSTETACHPGIYLAGLAWLRLEYGTTEPLVSCFCRRDELLHAGDKWRCKRLWVSDYVG